MKDKEIIKERQTGRDKYKGGKYRNNKTNKERKVLRNTREGRTDRDKQIRQAWRKTDRYK